MDAIEPDAKDWTWVLRERCPECGLEAGTLDIAGLPDQVRSWTPRWRAVLARPDVATRPRPDVWSPLEYACHVRDVHRLFAERLTLLLEQDTPTFADWDQDAAAVAGRYDRCDPAVVADELAEGAEVMARLLATVTADQHGRRGLRSNGSEFTARTLAQYYAHDVLHHLHDVDG